MQIHLLHVNDVHSQLENYMRLGRQLKDLRQSLLDDGHAVLTFDLGDLVDRVRPETEASMGMQSVDMLAALGVDGWVFGNNEGLTIPTKDWPELSRRSQTVVFGTNLKNYQGQPFSFFEQVYVYNKSGLRIGVFGLTPNYNLPYGMLNVKAGDPFEEATQAVRSLTEFRVDAIVCLSHLGRMTDHRLAERVKGIDVILGGHTHEFMTDAEWVNQTAIFQPGKHARMFGHTTLVFDGDKSLQCVRCEAIPVNLRTTCDMTMLAAYKAHHKLTKAVLSRPIASISERLEINYERESTFPNLLADILYDEFSSDLSLMMTGALNASLLPGDVDMEQLLGACPTPTRPIVATIEGRYILSVLEKGLMEETYNRHGIGFGFRGGKIGALVVSGAKVKVCQRFDRYTIDAIKIGDVALRPDAEYRVATCEYMWLSPVFSEFRNALSIDYCSPLLRDVLLARLDDEGRVERAKLPRYHFCPENSNS